MIFGKSERLFYNVFGDMTYLIPSQIDAEFISKRTSVLEKMYGNRNTRMKLYERMYRLDTYDGSAAAAEEIRVALPIAHNLVEKSRAMMIGRPPVVSVPSVGTNEEGKETAEKIERWMIGALSRMQFVSRLADAEFWAACAGKGWLKLTWDPFAMEDEFPIVLVAPDPKTLFPRYNNRRDRVVELADIRMRTRRDIEDEWGGLGFKFSRPIGLDSAQTAEWMEEEIRYIEYWLETIQFVKNDEKNEGGSQKNVIDSPALSRIQRVVQGADGENVASFKGLEGENEPFEKKEPGENENKEIPDDTDDFKNEPAPNKKKIRRVIHSVVAEDILTSIEQEKNGALGIAVIKSATHFGRYDRIPFFGWPGKSVPLPGEHADQSVLYPLAKGDASAGALGVFGAYQALASIDIQSAIDSPNAPIFSDDPDHAISMERNKVNYVSPGTKVWRLQPDVTNPAVQRAMASMQDQMFRSGIHELMDGPAHMVSGQSVSGQASVHQMVIGQRMNLLQEELSRMLEFALRLVRSCAVDEKWEAYGTTTRGEFVKMSLGSEDVPENPRVLVKLSASMPKDSIGLASVLSALAAKNQISLETFLDLFQKLPEFGLASDSPAEEIERILRDRMLMSGPMAESLAQALSMGYVMRILNDGAVTPEEQMMAQQFMQKLMEQSAASAGQGPSAPPGGANNPNQMMEASPYGSPPEIPEPPNMPGSGGIPMGNVMPGGGAPPPRNMGGLTQGAPNFNGGR